MILHKRLYDVSNHQRFLYFTKLVDDIKTLDSEEFQELYKIIIKVLKRTKLYDDKKDIIDLIERLTEKKLSYSKKFMNLQKLNQYKPEPNEKLSEDGKFINTYFTTKDLEGNIVSSYYMSASGCKKGLSDQYKIFKMKQLIEKESPIFDSVKEIVDCYESLFNLEKLNQKNKFKEYKNLQEYELLLMRVKKLQRI